MGAGDFLRLEVKKMGKFAWLAAGAGLAALGMTIFGTVAIAQSGRDIRYVSDMTGDYEIDMTIAPGRVRAGNYQQVIIKLLKNKKPVSGATIKLQVQRKTGISNETVTTDATGTALAQFVSFNVQTMTFTALYTTPGGNKVQVSATGKWCNCGGED